MRLMLLAATALTVTGSALAYQTVATDMDPSTTMSTDATTTATIAVDPSIAVSPPHTWTAEQRALWDQHLASLPANWSVDQRATFEAMMALPPASWSLEQRALYEQHMASLPSSWTPEQRTIYEQQVASLRTPWLGATQTAAIDSTAVTTSGQANLQTFAGMGGPYEEVYGTGSVSLTPRPADKNYPPCSPGPGDDNCIQLYERGVRDQLASWNRPTGGLIDGAATTAMGGPFEPADRSGPSQPAAQSSTTTTSSTSVDHSVHTGTSADTADPTGTTQDDTVEPEQ